MKQFKNYNFRLLAVTLIVLFVAACTNDDFTAKDSTADFSVAINDLEVSFTANSKYAVSLTWDFGDGTTSTKVNPIHTYAEDGDYTVILTANAAIGANSDIISRTISVSRINPTAAFTSEIDNKTVTFTNISERALSYAWDFGDGETSTEENPVHTYAESGEYSVTLTTTGVVDSTPATVTKILAVAVGSFGISVENGDFQLPANGKQTNWANVPGWNSDTQAADSGVEEGDNGWTAYRMSSDPSVYNLTDHVIAADELFKVNLQAWDAWNSSQIIVTLYYDTGDGIRNVLATQTFDLVPDQTVVFELAGAATTAAVGANLGIMIDNVSTNADDAWTGFDNVELFVK